MLPDAKWVPKGNLKESLTPSPLPWKPDPLLPLRGSTDAPEGCPLPSATMNAISRSDGQAPEGQPGTLHTEEDLIKPALF